MLDPIPDRERLLARGRVIFLADGSEVVVRFDFLAAVHLEEQFGSLPEFQDAINARDAAGNPAGPILTVTRKAIAAALTREGITYEDLGELLELDRRYEYLQAVIAAYNEAMATGDGTGKVSAAESGSRGGSSTSTRRSATAAATTTSGA